MKRLLLFLLYIIVTLSAVDAQGRLGHSSNRTNGGNLTNVELIKHYKEYPESLPNYIPPDFARYDPARVLKASGWRKPAYLSNSGEQATTENDSIIKKLYESFFPFFDIINLIIQFNACFVEPYQLSEATGKHLKLPQGYVVYKTDTIYGYVTVDKSDVYVEQPIDSDKSFYYSYKMKNSGLKCVVVYNKQNKQMMLVRLNENDKKLWRVIHEGKVSLYDDGIGFIYQPEDIDKDNITIVCEGEMETLTTYFGFDVKRTLMDYINRSYGLNLKPQDHNWRELLGIIDNLD